MSIATQKFTRKSFEVEAVRVDESNMEEIAQWCGGKVRTEKPWSPKDSKKDLTEEQKEYAEAHEKRTTDDQPGRKHIKVKVKNPINDRQTKAFVGDWVLYTDERSGFKVYNNHAFERSFTPVNGIAQHEDNRSAVTGQFVSDEEAAANPDTTVHEVS